MILYEVRNGYVGEGAVHVLVVAENEDRAKALAVERFRREAEQDNQQFRQALYEPSYWDIARMTVIVLVDDLHVESCSKVRD